MNFDISAWRSRVCDFDLARPGQAFALPLRNTTVRYFQGLVPLTASVYRPGFVGIARQGTADVRIRKVFPPTGEGLALEGTIRSAERLSSNENDLLSIHLPLSEGNADLLGHLDFTQARSEGEAVFRTIPQTFSPALTSALPFIEGSAYSRMAFDTLSPRSTPFDLYFAEPNAGEATLPPRLLVGDAGVRSAPVPQAAAGKLPQGLRRRPAARIGNGVRRTRARVGRAVVVVASVPAGELASEPGGRAGDQVVMSGES